MRDRFGKCLGGLLPDSGGAVLLAVSGGIDSMVMADLFLNSPISCPIALAHCNFHLRGEESDADESFVRDWAKSHGVRFIKADFDTLEYSRSHGVSVEMAARELRYDWFRSVCEDEGFGAVAVAHNANDNAETLILNLLRGTGLKGICGMKELSVLPGSSVKLMRPLLGFTRDEIKAYALSNGMSWREDSTNADSAFKRNLIRNEVFPLFAKINPSFLETLNSDMRRFSQVQGVADDYVFSSVRFAPYPGKWSAGEQPSPDAADQPLVISVRKLREIRHWEYVLYRILEPYGFNESVISDLTELIKSGRTFSGRQFHSPTHIASTTRTTISIMASGCGGSPSASLRFAPYPGKWSAEGDTPHPGAGPSDGGGNTEGGEIVVTGAGEYNVGSVGFVVEMADIQSLKQPVGTTIANLGFPFTIRHWKEGDWMRPLGMKGRRKKLSDMFGDLKFSALEKERALVIAGEGSHVLALVGYRIDESIALSDLDLEGKAGEHKLTITLCPSVLPVE